MTGMKGFPYLSILLAIAFLWGNILDGRACIVSRNLAVLYTGHIHHLGSGFPCFMDKGHDYGYDIPEKGIAVDWWSGNMDSLWFWQLVPTIWTTVEKYLSIVGKYHPVNSSEVSSSSSPHFDAQAARLSFDLGQFLSPLDLLSGPSVIQILSRGGRNDSIAQEFCLGVGINTLTDASTMLIQSFSLPAVGHYIVVNISQVIIKNAVINVKIIQRDFTISVFGEKDDHKESPSLLTQVNHCRFDTPVKLEGYIALIQRPMNDQGRDFVIKIASALASKGTEFGINICEVLMMTPLTPKYVAISSTQSLTKILSDIKPAIVMSYI